MKINLSWLVGASLFSGLVFAGNAQSAVTCATANLAGEWSIAIRDAGGLGYCPKVVLRRAGYVNANLSSTCTFFDDVGPDGETLTIKLTGGRLQLNTDCSMKAGFLKVRITTPAGSENARLPIKFGRLAKDKNSVMFYGRESDGWAIQFDGLKAP